MSKLLFIFLFITFYFNAECQTITFTELNGLYPALNEKEFPFPMVELLESKNFEFYSKRNYKSENIELPKKYYYTYVFPKNSNSNDNETIYCLLDVDESFEDKIPRGNISIMEFQFSSKYRKDYEYLVGKIKQYCFNEFDTGFWVSNTKTIYYYEKKLVNGKVKYLISINFQNLPLDKLIE